MNFTPIKFCLMPYAPQRLYLAVNRERALIPKTLYVFNCAIVNRHLVIDIWVHYWKVAVPSTGRRYVDCRTPWSYSYAGTGERGHWSLISQLGEQSKDYFHEVIIQSDDPGHFLKILSDQSSNVVIDSIRQRSLNEINVILSTPPTNSILESPCFSLSDY